jgi:hypothetical protein
MKLTAAGTSKALESTKMVESFMPTMKLTIFKVCFIEAYQRYTYINDLVADTARMQNEPDFDPLINDFWVQDVEEKFLYGNATRFLDRRMVMVNTPHLLKNLLLLQTGRARREDMSSLTNTSADDNLELVGPYLRAIRPKNAGNDNTNYSSGSELSISTSMLHSNERTNATQASRTMAAWAADLRWCITGMAVLQTK